VSPGAAAASMEWQSCSAAARLCAGRLYSRPVRAKDRHRESGLALQDWIMQLRPQIEASSSSSHRRTGSRRRRRSPPRQGYFETSGSVTSGVLERPRSRPATVPVRGMRGHGGVSMQFWESGSGLKPPQPLGATSTTTIAEPDTTSGGFPPTRRRLRGVNPTRPRKTPQRQMYYAHPVVKAGDARISNAVVEALDGATMSHTHNVVGMGSQTERVVGSARPIPMSISSGRRRRMAATAAPQPLRMPMTARGRIQSVWPELRL
jgi:hypothetical protein